MTVHNCQKSPFTYTAPSSLMVSDSRVHLTHFTNKIVILTHLIGLLKNLHNIIMYPVCYEVKQNTLVYNIIFKAHLTMLTVAYMHHLRAKTPAIRITIMLRFRLFSKV